MALLRFETPNEEAECQRALLAVDAILHLKDLVPLEAMKRYNPFPFVSLGGFVPGLALRHLHVGTPAFWLRSYPKFTRSYPGNERG